MSDPNQTETNIPAAAPAPEGAEISAVMGIINKYPKLTLVVLAMLFGGTNVGNMMFKTKCDPELTQHIQDIKAAQEDAKTEAKTNTDKVDEHLTVIKEDVVEIRTEQIVMGADIVHIKEDVKENKEDIKDLKDN